MDSKKIIAVAVLAVFLLALPLFIISQNVKTAEIKISETMTENQKPEFVAASSDEFISIYDNGDGTRTAKLSPVPINYRDESGTLKPISIVAEKGRRQIGRDIYDFYNENNTYKSYFKKNFTENNAVRYEYKGHWISVTPLDIRIGKAKMSNDAQNASVLKKQDSSAIAKENFVTYKEAYGNIDVSYAIGSAKLKEQLIIKEKPEIIADMLIPVKIDNDPELTVSYSTTRISFISDREIFYFPRPFVEYADNSRKWLDYKIDKNKKIISIFVPAALLNGPYPLRIDPSISANLSGSANILLDATANESTSSDSIPLDQRISVVNAVALDERRAYLKWNITEKISREAEAITSATVEAEQETTLSNTIGAYEVYREHINYGSDRMAWIIQPCGPVDATFNSSCNTTAYSTTAVGGSANDRFNFSITLVANRSLNKTINGLLGVFAMLFDASGTNLVVGFSSEAGSNNEPILYLTYTVNPPRVNFTAPTPANGSIANNTWFVVNVSVTENALQNTSSFIDVKNSTGSYTLVAYWSLDNVTSDNSTWGNNATGYNGLDCSPNILGRFGSACNFDGANDHINMTDTNSLEVFDKNFTVEAWVKPSDVTTVNIINKTNGTNYYGLSIDSSSKAQFSLINGSANAFTVNSTSSITANRLTHIAGVRDGGRMIIYVDGHVEGNVSESAGYIDTGSSTLMIGAGSTFVNNFNGVIDEVRIFRRALSGNEINASARGLPLLVNFTNQMNGNNYSVYAHSVDEGGAFNRTEIRSFSVFTDTHVTNITLPAGNSTNISYGGSVNKDFTMRCDVQVRNAESHAVNLIIEQNITGAWQQIAAAGANPADYLTVPSDNPAGYACGSLPQDGSCANTWTVSGKNTRENVGIRCRSNSTKNGADDSTSDRIPIVSIKNGNIAVTWNLPTDEITDLTVGEIQELNATLSCQDYFCGGINWTARTDDTGAAPSTAISDATQVQLMTGANNFNCGNMDVNVTCVNNITVNMTVGSFIGISREVDAIGVGNNSNITTETNSRTLVGLKSRALINVFAGSGKIYNRGGAVVIYVLVTDRNGQPLTNAVVNVTVFYINNSIFKNITASQFQAGRYNATFSLSDTEPYGPYHIAVNVSSGSLTAFADDVFVVAPALSEEQNATLYNISARVIQLNVTLLNQSNFGRYSIRTVLDDLNATRNILKDLLDKHYDFTQEEIFLVTDAMSTIDSITASLSSGSITDAEAQKQLEEIKKSLSLVTGKALSGQTSLLINVIIILISVSITFVLLYMKKIRKIQKIGYSMALPQNRKILLDLKQSAKIFYNDLTIKGSINAELRRKKEQLKQNYMEFKSGNMTKSEYDESSKVIKQEINGLKLKL